MYIALHKKEDILADADVADLALVDHLLELLPRGVRVGGQVKVELVSRTLLDGDRPEKPSWITMRQVEWE